MAKIQDFDFNVNLLESLLWQYNEAETLQSILQQKQDWFDENYTDFWDNWYNDVFNIDTANDFGLAVWAKILDVSFSIPPQPTRTNKVWGFGSFRVNFNRGNFSPTGGDDISLTTEQKRSILKLTYIKYVSRGTVPEINRTLTQFFGFKVYVLDSFNMSGNLAIFKQQIPQSTLRILEEYDLIPRPAAVGIETRIVTGNEFGFGSTRMNFNRGFFGA